jgi:hypothetical protein
MIFEDLGYIFVRYNTIKAFKFQDFQKQVLLDMLISDIHNCWSDNCSETIIKNIDNLFICYLTNKGVEKLKEFIDPFKYEYLTTTNYGYIAGYIYLNHKTKGVKHIRFCDTHIAKLNIMYHTINRAELKYKCMILPKDSLVSARTYWYKFIKTKYNIHTKAEYNVFKQDKGMQFILCDFFE